MASKMAFKTTFEPEKVIQPIFTGGSIALDNKARILASTLGEEAVLTDITTGRRLATIEGVRSPASPLTVAVHV
jgi:U3 small nucleolar RNA-associated protein 13